MQISRLKTKEIVANRVVVAANLNFSDNAKSYYNNACRLYTQRGYS